MVLPVQAHADWPGATRVATTLAPNSPNPIYPVGTAIRNWGPQDEVFISVDVKTDDSTVNDIEADSDLYWYTCSNNDTCATATLQSTTDVGTTIYGRNLPQSSLAIRRRWGQPIEVLHTLRQKIELDCDGDGDEYRDDFTDEGNLLDLGAKLFSTTSGEIESWQVDANDGSGRCENHGISFSRFVTNSTDPMACYTRNSDDPNPGTAPYRDRLTCNTYDGNPSGTGAAWDNREVMYNNGENEDHPSFVVYGSGDHLAVSGTWRGAQGNSTDEIRVHFPDAAAPPPNEDIVSFPSTGTKVEYSHLEDHGGKLHLVWADRTSNSASVRYQSCDYAFGNGVYCNHETDWLSSDTIVADSSTGYHRDAQGPVFAMDGDRQFVAWQYNANSDTNPRWRVVVANRCVGDPSWSYEEVRGTTDARDQYVVEGRPSLVLNRAENIAHIVFIEAEGYTGGFQGFNSITNADAWWYRTSYSECP